MTDSEPTPQFLVKAADKFGKHSRTLFSGLEDDARKFLTDHFPRLHVNPGSQDEPIPDAVLAHPDGTVQFHDGTKWQDHETSKPPATTDDEAEV